MEVRLTPEQRRDIIVAAAVALANERTLVAVNVPSVAERCRVATSAMTVRRYFFTKQDLWAAVVAHEQASAAVKSEGAALGL